MSGKPKKGKSKSKSKSGKSGSKSKKSSTNITGDSPLTEEQIADLKKVFNIFTKGKGGQIKLDQLGQVMRAAGGVPTEEELNMVTRELASQEKTVLSFIDFTELIVEHRSKHGYLEQELKEAFEIFDDDCDGYIETSELIKVLTAIGDTLTDKEADEMIKEVDLNGDGKIDYIEFVGMTSKPK